MDLSLNTLITLLCSVAVGVIGYLCITSHIHYRQTQRMIRELGQDEASRAGLYEKKSYLDFTSYSYSAMAFLLIVFLIVLTLTRIDFFIETQQPELIKVFLTLVGFLTIFTIALTHLTVKKLELKG